MKDKRIDLVNSFENIISGLFYRYSSLGFKFLILTIYNNENIIFRFRIFGQPEKQRKIICYEIKYLC